MILSINIQNEVLNEAIEIGVDKTKYVLRLADFGQIEAKRSTTAFINLIGENVDATKLSPRSITIKGSIIHNGIGMNEKKTVLNRLINPYNPLTITYSKYKIVAKADRTVSFPTEPERNNDHICDFLIQATAYEPIFKRINEEVFYYSTANKVPLFPLMIPKNRGICFGKFSTITARNVVNDGDIETGFIARLIAEEGPITNPKITNNKTGKYIELILSMQQGDIAEISTVTGNKYVKFIRGSTETDIFKMVTKKSTMGMTLNTGMNDISITAALNTANLNSIIKFTPLYLEVQQ